MLLMRDSLRNGGEVRTEDVYHTRVRNSTLEDVIAVRFPRLRGCDSECDRCIEMDIASCPPGTIPRSNDWNLWCGSGRLNAIKALFGTGLPILREGGLALNYFRLHRRWYLRQK